MTWIIRRSKSQGYLRRLTTRWPMHEKSQSDYHAAKPSKQISTFFDPDANPDASVSSKDAHQEPAKLHQPISTIYTEHDGSVSPALDADCSSPNAQSRRDLFNETRFTTKTKAISDIQRCSCLKKNINFLAVRRVLPPIQRHRAPGRDPLGARSLKH